MKMFYGKRMLVLWRQHISPSVGRYLIHGHNSRLIDWYHFEGTFEAHQINCVACNPHEDEAHGVEVERSPMVLSEHVGISCDENYEIDFLCFVGETDNILVG